MARRARHGAGDLTSHRAADGVPHGDAGPDNVVAGSQADPDEDLRSADESAAADGDLDLGERDHGPFDATELDMEQTDAVGRLDFGSVRVPMPDEARLQVESAPGGRLKAVHVLVPLGRLSISALAAPRSEPLWHELSSEILVALKQDGAWVRWEAGPWGNEMVAGTPSVQCRFIGVDGPRWMLYGVATGPTGGLEELTEVLRDMIRGTIVARDEQPYPVRTVLPLTAPPHLSAQLEKLQVEQPIESQLAPPSEPVQPVPRQPVSGQPITTWPDQPGQAEPPPPMARPVTPPPAAAAAPPAPVGPASSEPGWQPHDAGPMDSGNLPRHVLGQHGATVPKARHAEHSNPGTATPLPLQPEPPWPAQGPRSADPLQFRRPAGQQQPRGVRRPPRRPPDEHGVPTPPSWRAIGDPLNDPLGGWSSDPVSQPPDYASNEPVDQPQNYAVADPLDGPVGEGEAPPTPELPTASGLVDELQYWTPSEPHRRSGRHRLPD